MKTFLIGQLIIHLPEHNIMYCTSKLHVAACMVSQKDVQWSVQVDNLQS